MVDEVRVTPDAGHWPVALWRWNIESQTVEWANADARRLFGLPPVSGGASGAEVATDWPAWLGGVEPTPPGWEPVRDAVCNAQVRAQLTTESGAEAAADIQQAWMRLLGGEPSAWQITARPVAGTVWLAAMPVAAARARSADPNLGTAGARDVLLREVHHRLKNNLQGVSGLLRQQAMAHPQAAPWLEGAAAQLQAMAQVYGLPLPGGAAPGLYRLVQAVAKSVSSVFGLEIPVHLQAAEPPVPHTPEAPSHSQQGWQEALLAHLPPRANPWWGSLDSVEEACVHPDQAGALALVLNELMTNAVKHRHRCASAGMRELQVALAVNREGCQVDIVNAGDWPSGLALDHLPPGIQGLGLAKALLPSRGTRLEIITEPGSVCARLHIGPPCLLAPSASAPQSFLDSPAA